MNTSKTLLVSTAVVMALALILAPSAMSENAFAKKKYKTGVIAERIIVKTGVKNTSKNMVMIIKTVETRLHKAYVNHNHLIKIHNVFLAEVLVLHAII
jgi:hypothetical protein